MTLLKLAFIALAAYIVSVVPVLAQAAKPVSFSGRIVDEQQRPLAYVSVGILNTAVGTVADETGSFILYISDKTTDTDTVRFSLIGYRSLNLTISILRSRLATGQPLVLREQPQQLREVLVTSRKTKNRTLGNNGKLSSMYTNFALGHMPRQNLGAEIGRKFDLPRGNCRLESYRFRLASNFDSVRVRVNVYTVKGFRNLLSQNIYVSINKKMNNWVEVDLTPYDIVVNENVVVSVQWVDRSAKGSFLGMPITIPAAATHYYKYGSQDRWKKFPGMSTAMMLRVACGVDSPNEERAEVAVNAH